MSYDATVTCPTCQCNIYEGNFTTNVSRLYQREGLDLKSLDKLTGIEALPRLQRTISRIKSNLRDDEGRSYYREELPKNGWGSVTGALEFLESIRDAICVAPESTVHISY